MAFVNSNIQLKVKVKLSLCITKYQAMKTHSLLKHHAMKTYFGSGHTAPRPGRLTPVPIV